MALSWNEIKERASIFTKEWKDDFNEDAEAKSFMDDFFNVFGVPRRRVASFETHVKKETGKQGFIDLLWKGNILIEFKSRGKDLDKAHQQAKDYFPGLKDGELPKYILVAKSSQTDPSFSIETDPPFSVQTDLLFSGQTDPLFLV